LTLYADDFGASKVFYAGLLGWKAVPEAGPAASGIRFYANHLQYVELVSPPTKGQDDRLDGVAFLTADAEQLRAYLGGHGVAVPASVTVEKNGDQSFTVLDPEGNKVGFVEPGKHSPARPANAGERLSTHIMHAGYLVRDRAMLDHFYKDLLGFHLYWQGGNPSSRTDWVMMQAPEGSDWIEYMLGLPDPAPRGDLGSANHLAPGVVSVAELQKRLEAKGWKHEGRGNPQVLGVDGKMQLDLHDPDGTRVEFMEFVPVQTACCSAYTGEQPKPSDAW
jgi:catechol 2,3-dioxygenase-like lactoylglutathione lyase family enzyme